MSEALISATENCLLANASNPLWTSLTSCFIAAT